MLVEFRGFGVDFLIVGRLELTASRLTDMVNGTEELVLRDVVLEGLSDLARVTVPDYAIRRDDLLAIKASGPRGARQRRIVTTPHRVQAQLGPYNVLGRLHTGPGESVRGSLASRGPMLPLTDATIAYVIGGILEVRDAATILVNREAANWLRDEETDRLIVPGSASALPFLRPVEAVAALRARAR